MSNGGAQFFCKQFIDETGSPYAGVKIYTYTAGTNTNKTVWQDEGKTTAASNPVTGDSRGYIWFYGDGDYKLKVADSSDNILYTWDNVRITEDTATMWEGNQGTSYPNASTANRWQLAVKHTAGNVFQEIGINDGSSFVSIISNESNLRYAADTGAADAYVVTLSPALTAYTAGIVVYFKATNANTGASTLNVNGLGAKSIVKEMNEALIANDILASHLVQVQYDGTNFQMMSFPGSTGNAAADIPLSNGTVCVNLNAEQHNGLKVKVIDIGDWDMNVSVAGAASVTVAHGLTLANIRAIKVTIRNDSNNAHYPLDYNTGAADNGGQWFVTATNVTCGVVTSGPFDSASFNDGSSYNRGWVTIWYVP